MSAEPDYSPALFRRIAVMSERMDTLYMALHLALIVIFCGLMVALWVVREDIIKVIGENKS